MIDIQKIENRKKWNNEKRKKLKKRKRKKNGDVIKKNEGCGEKKGRERCKKKINFTEMAWRLIKKE